MNESSTCTFGVGTCHRMGLPTIDALSRNGKGEDYLCDAEFELHSQASLSELCISHLGLDQVPHSVCFDIHAIES
jgi:hypothetical protein